MLKVTMQDIADELNISRVSVWKVFNKQSEVSETLKKKVLSKAQEMGYVKGPAEQPDASETKTISIIVSRPESSSFWSLIVNQIAQELSRLQINLMYTFATVNQDGTITLPVSYTNGTLDGIIVLNAYDEQLLRSINELDIPKVFLDTMPSLPFPELKGDLILIEGSDTMYQITEDLVNKGITDFSFIGDIQYAQTNLDRYEGVRRCLQDHSIPLKPESCLTHRIGIYSYFRELYEFLDSLPQMPEAILCASDYIAHFVQQYFWEHANRFAVKPVITGFDGVSEYTSVIGTITTACVDTENLGIRLTHQLLYRMSRPDSPYEKTYISTRIRYGQS